MDMLGEKMKALRKKKGKTLKALAEKTDLSISFLSQVERGKSSATLESLKKISMELGVNPGYFFDDYRGNGKQSIQKVDLSSPFESEQNVIYRSLSANLKAPQFEPMYVVLKPGKNEGNRFRHPGQEFLYVLEGKLTVEIDFESYEVTAMQSIMFESEKEHYWYNYTDEDVKFLCVQYDYDK